MPGRLEHLNVTVADPQATAEMLSDLFGWKIRWEGAGMDTGYTIHVGSDDTYLAVFSYGDNDESREESYRHRGGLNHVGIVVDDLDATEKRVKARGYVPGEHHDYEPGRRFYFKEENGIEIEVVSYA